MASCTRPYAASSSTVASSWGTGAPAELLATRLTAAKRLVEAARELLLQALLLADGRLQSFERLSEAVQAVDRAAWSLQDELDEISGYARRTREVIEEALGGDAG